jgi:mono/diheme cytochrome c family protein
LLAYVLSDKERLAEVKGPLFAFLTERRFAPVLGLVVLAIPTAVAASIYLDMTSPAVPPNFGRTVHPAPPGSIQVHDSTFDMATLDNPYRHLEKDNPEEFQSKVQNGREVYYRNCFYCHGDLLAGDGMFIHGLNPIPTNFQDQGTLPILQESFIFWRISKGAPGLPEEGGPWASAMPAWEKFLSEDEIWDVILFIYDFTGARPRALAQHGGEGEH